MTIEDAYNQAMFGRDEPDMMITASSKGPVMLTREGAYLLDDDGNVIAEIDRDHWIKELNSKVFIEVKGIS